MKKEMWKKGGIGAASEILIGIAVIIAITLLLSGPFDISKLTGFVIIGGTGSLKNRSLNCSGNVNESIKLTSDILGCNGTGLIINASYITLDCDGHIISGMRNSSGIYNDGFDGILIKNCIIKNFTQGICFNDSSFNIFTDINISNISDIGINYYNGSIINFTSIIIKDINNTGIKINHSNGNITINNSKITESKIGIYLDNIDAPGINAYYRDDWTKGFTYDLIFEGNITRILDSNISNNSEIGIKINYADFIQIENCDVNDNGLIGIFFNHVNSTTNHTLIDSCNVKRNNQSGDGVGIYINDSHIIADCITLDGEAYGYGYGIIEVCNDPLIQINNSNVADNGLYGIRISHSDGRTFNKSVGSVGAYDNSTKRIWIKGNNFIDNHEKYGVWLEDTNYTWVDDNEGYNSVLYDFYLLDSNHNNVTRNIADVEIGFFLNYSGYNRLFHDFTENNTKYGFFLYYSDYNWLHNCTANNNSIYGVYLQNSFDNNITNATVTNNSIHGAYFNYSERNIISNSYVANNTDVGILLEHSPNNTLVSNIVTDDVFGIKLDLGSNNNAIGDNIIKNASQINVLINISHANILAGNEIKFSLVGINISNSNYTAIVDLNNSGTLTGNLGNNIINNSLYGIFAENANATLIENNTISYNGEGIWFERRVQISYVSFNEISYNTNFGIYMNESDNNDILNNNITDNGDSGLYASYSNNNSIFYNNIWRNNEFGIYLGNSNISIIYTNDINDSLRGIYLNDYSNNNIISNNIVEDCNYSGIYLEQSSYTSVEDNRIDGVSNGIYLDDNSIRNNITGNSVSNCNETGIYIFDSSYSYIALNTVEFIDGDGIYLNGTNTVVNLNVVSNINGSGINLSSSINAKVTSNYISNNDYGITFFNSENNSLTSNNIINNENGIKSVDSKRNNLTSNFIGNNTNHAIYFSNSNASILTGNYIINSSVGINLTNSYDNLIYNNYFAGHLIDVVDNGNNLWNTSYNCSIGRNIVYGDCIGGNYWENYTGADDGSGVYPHNISFDGIGDTLLPYKGVGNGIISGGDDLPLISRLSFVIIWDETDYPMPYTTTDPKYVGDDVKFFANFTTLAGTPQNAKCEICFYDGLCDNMTQLEAYEVWDIDSSDPEIPDVPQIVGDIAADHAGNVYVAGHYKNNSDIIGFIRKIDSLTGELLWEKNISDFNIRDAVVDINNNLIVAGNVNERAAVIKYDPDGNITWGKGLGTRNTQKGYFFSRYEGFAGLGSYYVTGSYVNALAIGQDGETIFIVGTIQKRPKIGDDYYAWDYYLSSINPDNGYERVLISQEIANAHNDWLDVIVDSNGYVIFVGDSGDDWYIGKRRSTYPFTTISTTVDLGEKDRAKAVAVDSNNDIIVAGYCNNNSACIRKYNGSLSPLSDFNITMNINDSINFTGFDDIAVDSRDNLYAVATTNKGYFVVEFNSSGDQIWNRTLILGDWNTTGAAPKSREDTEGSNYKVSDTISREISFDNPNVTIGDYKLQINDVDQDCWYLSPLVGGPFAPLIYTTVRFDCGRGFFENVNPVGNNLNYDIKYEIGIQSLDNFFDFAWAIFETGYKSWEADFRSAIYPSLPKAAIEIDSNDNPIFTFSADPFQDTFSGILKYQGGLFVYNRSFNESGNHSWNVTCDSVDYASAFDEDTVYINYTLADFGDAPDSTNHFNANMTAYPRYGPPVVNASYPTVFDAATGLPQGPCHAERYLWTWLGDNVSVEVDADLLPDKDGVPNINVTIDSPDQDWYDDGLIYPLNLTNCTNSTFNFTVTITNYIAPQWGNYSFNVWFDWNRDGDWKDNFTCFNTGDAPEWAVQNQTVYVSNSGPYPVKLTFTTNKFLPYNLSEGPIWMRMTLAPNESMNSDGSMNGSSCFEDGETEDYYFIPCNDSDGDGYNVNTLVFLGADCGPEDCNDTNSSINPGATEICNGVDDDCDTLVDEENATGCTTFYSDNDGDGYGNATDSKCLCAPLNPYNTTNTTDCDDSNAAINPGATEICNGVDDDCDTLIDEGLPIACNANLDCGTDGCIYGTYYIFACNNPGTCFAFCSNTTNITDNDLDGYDIQCDGDCNDTNASINPGIAIDIVNGVDDDCDGYIDEGNSTVINLTEDNCSFYDAILINVNCTNSTINGSTKIISDILESTIISSNNSNCTVIDSYEELVNCTDSNITNGSYKYNSVVISSNNNNI